MVAVRVFNFENFYFFFVGFFSMVDLVWMDMGIQESCVNSAEPL